MTLDPATYAFASLHSDYSAVGEFEVSSRRTGLLFRTIFADLIRSISTIQIEAPPDSSVAWLGLWDANQVFQGMLPLGSSGPRLMSVDATDTTLFASAIAPGFTTAIPHGFTSGQTVVFWHKDLSVGLVLPPDITIGTIYTVINATADAFQVSLDGVTAVDAGGTGSGWCELIRTAVIPFQSIYTVTTILIQAG